MGIVKELMRCHPNTICVFHNFRHPCPSKEGERIGKSNIVHCLCRCFILTRSASFKYNSACFVQNWNWYICKGFFVLFLIYNLTDLFHQNKYLLNVIEMVLKSIMSARSPLNTTGEKGSTCMLKYTDPPTKWAMFQRQLVQKPLLYSYKHCSFFCP